MRSAKFSCEWTLWKKDLSRFWPLLAAYTVLWILFIPLDIFNQGGTLARTYAGAGMTGWAGDRAMFQVCNFNGSIFSCGYAVLCAMAVWSYLYHPRPANMAHALPVRREGHFAAHFLSGTAFFVLPHGVLFVLTLAAGLATGSRGDLPAAAGAFGLLTLLCLFFFSLATLCAFVTGHILALPAFYAIANFLAFGVTRLLNWVAERFLFGYTSFSLAAAVDAATWLSPILHLIWELRWEYGYTGEDVSGTAHYLDSIARPAAGAAPYTVTPRLEGLHVVLVYAAAALVLAGLALLLYRRRDLETAGDVVAVGWLRPVFLYGVAFCTALAGTWLLADLMEWGNRALITCLLALCGVTGYFIARMLLQKSLKVFRRSWKGALAVLGVLLTLVLGLEADLLGVERTIPDAAQVTKVQLAGPESLPYDSADYPQLPITDPALIQRLLAVHQTIIDHRRELKAAQDRRWDQAAGNSSQSYHYFRVNYHLQNGRVLGRKYMLFLSPEQLDDPASVTAALEELINDPAFNRLSYGLDAAEPNRLTELVVSGLAGKGQVIYYSPLSEYALDGGEKDGAGSAGSVSSAGLAAGLAGVPGEGPGNAPAAVADTARVGDGALLCPVSQETLAGLWQAVEADFAGGDLGKRWLFSDSEAYKAGTSKASLEFYWNERDTRADGEVYYHKRRVSISLAAGAVHTLSALEEQGLFSGGGYLTNYNDEQVWPAR